jgi:aryl-alcohol dehydrogenase-like predicted oxidoreductase
MKFNPMGSTSLFVSEIGFGAWAIGGDSYGKTVDRVSVAAINEALDHGCNLFDTADVYGEGHSEVLLGQSLRHAGKLNSVVIATKGGRFCGGDSPPFDFSGVGITSSVEASLRRLGRDFIDIYQLHNPPMDVLRNGAVFETLDGLRERGLIRYSGVSIQTLAEARISIASGRISTLQTTYNLLSLLNPEMSLEQLRASLEDRHVGVLAREPLANGFLSGRLGLETRYDDRDIRGKWPSELRRQRICLAETLRPLERPGVTLAQVALRFVLDEPLVTSVLVGIKTPEQARENFGTLELPSFSELAADFNLKRPLPAEPLLG